MTPNHLETPRLLLRPFELSDAPAVQRLAGAIEIARVTLNVPHPYEDGMAEQWIERQQRPENRAHTSNFAITQRENSELCGCIGLSVNQKQSQAELGYWIGVPFWNLGYGTEAARAIIGFAFETLQLERVQARHLDINPASGRVMQKIGMQFEGISRKGARKGNTFYDLAHYAILREDWQG
ncbi:N-acetyltransferase [bacterium]|nr:MAG: N-acetyltransferase [bacterium]